MPTEAETPCALRAADLGDDLADSYTAGRIAFELARIAAIAAGAPLEWKDDDGGTFATLLPGVTIQTWQASDMPEGERFGFRVLAEGDMDSINGPEDSIFGDLWHIADRQIRARIAQEQPERIRLLHRIHGRLAEVYPEQAKRVEEKLSQ